MRQTLDSVCALIVDCEHKTAPPVMGGEHPLVRTPDIGIGRLVMDRAQRITVDNYRVWTKRAVPRPGDLILAREAPVGNVGIVPHGVEPVLGQRTVLLRPDPTRINAQYLNYLLSGPQLRKWMLGVATGATVPHLNMADIRAMELPELPPLAVQHKIGSILSAYDELIENNNRRIKLVEELASRIYREWFVEFRFPGHETAAALVESPQGPIPSGWRWLPASEAITINPKLSVDRSAVRPFVPMASLSETGMHITPIEQRAGATGARFRDGDTLLARITPCLENGKTAFVQCLDGAVASGSTEFIVLRSLLLCPEYVYLLARSDDFRAHAIKSMSGATGRQRVKESCFDNYYCPVPAPRVLDAFANQVSPLFEVSHSTFNANSKLYTVRNILLPRLISGELDVTDLEIAVDRDAA